MLIRDFARWITERGLDRRKNKPVYELKRTYPKSGIKGIHVSLLFLTTSKILLMPGTAPDRQLRF
jgi:hypothetical protein